MPRINNDKFYKNALKKYGSNAKGLNWHDEHSQLKRFEIIRDILEPELKDKNLIIDAGCGFGDLYLYLSDLNINYIGYEILDEFIEVAKDKTKQEIYKKDILTDTLDKADFYIASGSMNILSRFETFLFIERCFNMSKIGFIFNLPYGKDESKSFNYFLPQEIKHFAKKFDCEVSTISGYLPNDFTVYLKHKNYSINT
jgi:SAM-dependent methyltransferase